MRKTRFLGKTASACLALSLMTSGLVFAENETPNKGVVQATQSDKALTRGEFIKAINQAFSFQQEAALNFKDVHKDDPAYADLARAVAAGYISGYTDGTIRLKESITRQEAAVILAQLAKLTATDQEKALSQYEDKESISSWSRAAVAALGENGAFSGPAFEPKKKVTGAEISALLKLIQDEGKGANVFHAPTGHGDITIKGAAITGENPGAIIDSAGCVPDVHEYVQGSHLAFAIDIQTTDATLKDKLEAEVEVWTTDENPTKVTTLDMHYDAHPPGGENPLYFWTVGFSVPTDMATGDYQYKFVVNEEYVFTPENNTFTVVEPGKVVDHVFKADTGRGELTIKGAAITGENPGGIIDSAGCVPNIHEFAQGSHLAFAIDIQTTDSKLKDQLKPQVEVWTTDSEPTKLTTLDMQYGPHQADGQDPLHFWTVGFTIPADMATGEYQYKFVVNGKYVFTPEQHNITVVEKTAAQ